MDQIFVRGLNVETTLGVHDWERRITQTLKVDLVLGTDTRSAAASDALEDTLDYAAIAERLLDLGASTAFSLVETFAERCADRLMNEFDIRWLRVCVTKEVGLSMKTEVGVIIERERDDGTRSG